MLLLYVPSFLFLSIHYRWQSQGLYCVLPDHTQAMIPNRLQNNLTSQHSMWLALQNQTSLPIHSFNLKKKNNKTSFNSQLTPQNQGHSFSLSFSARFGPFFFILIGRKIRGWWNDTHLAICHLTNSHNNHMWHKVADFSKILQVYIRIFGNRIWKSKC